MFLLLDIGGTKTRIAISHKGDKINATKIISTAQNFKETITNIYECAKELANGKKITSAVIGAPGPHNRQKTKITGAPNLPEWHNQPLKKELEHILETTVRIENDADLAGLGEAVFGAGQKHNIVAYLTISTGVGGTRIINQQLDQGIYSFEPGHQIITINNPNKQLTLENCVSGAGLEKLYGKPAEEITDPDVWKKTAQLLAIGLHNVTVHWSPHCIILGGSITKSLPFDILQTHFQQISSTFSELPVIKLSDLDDKAGLYGALAYLNNKQN